MKIHLHKGKMVDLKLFLRELIELCVTILR